MRLIRKVLFICILIALGIYLFKVNNSLFTANEDWIEINFEKLDLPQCAILINDHQIEMPPGCNQISIDLAATANLKINAFYILGGVESANSRSAINLEGDKGWDYSYHSGDGTRQYLLSKSRSSFNKSKLFLMADEGVENKKSVKFGPLYIIKDINKFVQSNNQFKSIWVRTNNPNHDFWFDRYTSLVQDFTITIPNEQNSIWEKYFGIGINDRFNTGDYFCFPDDKLVTLKNGQLKWFYLGFLVWKRAIYLDSVGRLIVEFRYDGPLESNERSLQPHAQSGVKINFGDKDVFLNKKDGQVSLFKKYIFSTDKNVAQVELTATASDLKDYYWIFEDASYMDFSIGNNFDVKSWSPKYNNDSFIIKPKNSLINKEQVVFQYRTRTGHSNLASSIFSGHADLYYALPDYIPQFLSNSVKGSPILFDDSFTEWQQPRPKSKVYGIGFRSQSGKILSQFYNIYFLSNFKETSMLYEEFKQQNDK